MPRRRRGFEGCAQVFYFARTPAVKKSPGLPDYKPVSVPASVARERAAAIPLGRRLLSGSSDLPGSRNGADRSCSPIWSCSAWGLPCRPRCRGRGALLPHLFTLTGRRSLRPATGGIFSVALSVKSALSESPRPLAGMPSYGDRTFLSRWRERLPIRQAQFQYKLSALSFQLSAPGQDRELAGGRLRLWLHRRHALETNGLSDTPACAGRDLDTDGFSRLAKFARFVFPSFPIPSPSGLVVLSRDARQQLCRQSQTFRCRPA